MPENEKITSKSYNEAIKSLKEKLRQNKEPEKLFDIVSSGLDVVAALGTSVPLFGTYMKLLSKGAQVAKSAIPCIEEDYYQRYKGEKESTGCKDEDNGYFTAMNHRPEVQKNFKERYEYEKKWEALKDRFDKIKKKDKDKNKEKGGPKNGSGGSGSSGSGSGG